MADMTSEIKVHNPAGYLTLGLLRLIVEQTEDFDDEAEVKAGIGDASLIDTIVVTGEFDVTWVPYDEDDDRPEKAPQGIIGRIDGKED